MFMPSRDDVLYLAERIEKMITNGVYENEYSSINLKIVQNIQRCRRQLLRNKNYNKEYDFIVTTFNLLFSEGSDDRNKILTSLRKNRMTYKYYTNNKKNKSGNLKKSDMNKILSIIKKL